MQPVVAMATKSWNKLKQIEFGNHGNNKTIWKNGHFSMLLWPDWGNTARAAMAGLGSIGLSIKWCGILGEKTCF